MKLDRFEFGLLDPQEKEVYCYCSVYKTEIYVGDFYYETQNGDILCDDKDVLSEYIGAIRKVAGEEVKG